MRSFLLLTLLLACAVCAYVLVPATAQAQGTGTCTVFCPGGATLKCCLSSGTCSSVPGSSINCNGTTLSCGPADVYQGCLNQCEADYDQCLEDCAGGMFCPGICSFRRNRCINNCGMAPVTNIGC